MDFFDEGGHDSRDNFNNDNFLSKHKVSSQCVCLPRVEPYHQAQLPDCLEFCIDRSNLLQIKIRKHLRFQPCCQPGHQTGSKADFQLYFKAYFQSGCKAWCPGYNPSSQGSSPAATESPGKVPRGGEEGDSRVTEKETTGRRGTTSSKTGRETGA